MSGHKVAVAITDKNGKKTTVWRNDNTNPNAFHLSHAYPPKPNAIQGEPTEKFWFARNEISTFTGGDCWRLAGAIREITGWEMVALGNQYEIDEAESEYPEDQYWSHMVVRHPSGYLIDIEGIYTEAEILEKWEPDEGVVFEASHPNFVMNAFPPSRLDPVIRARKIVEICDKSELLNGA